jgi:phosphoribosylformylglycinamidine synthase
VNCLNFGNPEHPAVMWQFGEVVDGIRDACQALRVPVIGGNVSFYNESHGADIDPTPVIGVIGLLERLDTVPPPAALAPGQTVVLLGATTPELGGSAWATRHQLAGGRPPTADLDAAVAVHDLVRGLVADRLVRGVHDAADGGVAVALAEMAIRGACGCRITPPPTLPAAAWCFSESASRVLVTVDPPSLDGLLERAAAAGVTATALGPAGGDRLQVDGALDVDVGDLTRAWRDSLPATLGQP